MFLILTDLQCPTGYIEKPGDITGWGFDYEPAASVEACAYRCTNQQECCVFEFSRFSKMCQLHKECYPNNLPLEDYISCQKSKHDYFPALLIHISYSSPNYVP